ncbi:MAG: TVP38/TMEM64 family protein [Hydrogenophilales bacterium]|nr:TVP38/TMEM64 family protein [Hydrogenophilales bacterium]
MQARAILRGLIFIASLVALGYVLEATHFGASINQAWIDAEVRGKGLSGELLFVGVGALAAALAMPRQIISFLGGYAFGFVLGTMLTLAAVIAGCVASFFYARWIGRHFITARFGTRIQRIDDFLGWNPFSMTLLIRLLPIGNNLATNLAAGVTSVRALPFFFGSLIGYIPQTLVFALAGSGVNVDPALRIGLAVLLFLVSGVIGVWLYRKYRHGHTLGAEVDAELDP